MSTLELLPTRRWFSWDFSILQNGSPIAEIKCRSSWREKGTLAIDGSSYEVYREGLMSGQFILELNGTRLVHAEKRSRYTRSFTVQHECKTYILKAESALGGTFLLLENGQQIGSIRPAGVFTWKATVELPDELPLPIKVFLLWLAVILWRRDYDYAIAAAIAAAS
jgi:hypothetical protein